MNSGRVFLVAVGVLLMPSSYSLADESMAIFKQQPKVDGAGIRLKEACDKLVEEGTGCDPNTQACEDKTQDFLQSYKGAATCVPFYQYN